MPDVIVFEQLPENSGFHAQQITYLKTKGGLIKFNLAQWEYATLMLAMNFFTYAQAAVIAQRKNSFILISFGEMGRY